MKIGYFKNISDLTSTNEFELVDTMKKEGVEKIIVEVITNDGNCQQMLLDIIETMKSNDILVVQSLDALGETLEDIINIIKKLDEKDLDIQVLEKSFLHLDLDINKLSIHKVLRKQLLAILEWMQYRSQQNIIKRNKILEETKSQQGSGRPRKYSAYAKNPEDREVYFNVVNMLKNDIPIKRISEKLDISRNTVYTIKNILEKEIKDKNIDKECKNTKSI